MYFLKCLICYFMFLLYVCALGACFFLHLQGLAHVTTVYKFAIVNQVAMLLTKCDFIMRASHLTFASASTLGLCDSEHSVAFKNLSRKSTIVGTQI